ncbi:hypothetical protein M0D21_18165 [Aquimarina sp. D1M17]|uniref:hypothetical protein n=1 Tax=Aquimarina acroporae TaxID=2937283 RepID=UPI0020BE6FD3|nr:hypothetical protein [Aquimarina acroporae]MCK8523514.1 hypothetical protein [Aquimarina acroporae]
MKFKLIAILFIAGIIASGFTTEKEVYDGIVYQLDVESLTGKPETFSLKIVSTPYGKTESKEIVLNNVQTPFEKTLLDGTHVISIDTYSDKKTIQGTIIGLVDGKKKTGASSVNEETKTITLYAGPDGKCGAAQ